MLSLSARVISRYALAAKKLREKSGGSTPTAEQLIKRELSLRTARGIIEDYEEGGLRRSTISGSDAVIRARSRSRADEI